MDEANVLGAKREWFIRRTAWASLLIRRCYSLWGRDGATGDFVGLRVGPSDAEPIGEEDEEEQEDDEEAAPSAPRKRAAAKPKPRKGTRGKKAAQSDEEDEDDFDELDDDMDED